jgi:hypothetical protein
VYQVGKEAKVFINDARSTKRKDIFCYLLLYKEQNKNNILYFICNLAASLHRGTEERAERCISRSAGRWNIHFFLFCVNSDRVKTTLMLLVFVAVCGNAVRSSGASDITLPSGSKFKTREDEEGARYWVGCREVLVRQFFVCLSLEEIGNTGFSLALRASIVNGVPDI